MTKSWKGHKGEDYRNAHVLVMNADGSGKEHLDPRGWCARWSPDGRKIAWVAYDNGANLCVHDLIEGDRRMVLEGEHRRYVRINHSFTWSPDGKTIVFPSGRRK